jgi:hypothetical protein
MSVASLKRNGEALPCQQDAVEHRPAKHIHISNKRASSTATSSEKSTINNKPEGISPLAIQYFSDIEEHNNNGKMNVVYDQSFIVESDNADDNNDSIEDEDK